MPRTATVSKKESWKYPRHMNFEGKRYSLHATYASKSEAAVSAKYYREGTGGAARVVGPRWSTVTTYKYKVKMQYLYALYIRPKKAATGAYQNIGGKRWKYIHADKSKTNAKLLAVKWRTGGRFYGPIRARVVKRGNLWLVYLNCKDYTKQTGKKC